MEIKGPTGISPVEAIKVEPSTAGRTATDSQPALSQSVQLRLSPSLFQLGQLLDVIVTKVDRQAVTLLLQNRINGPDGQPLTIQLQTSSKTALEVGQRLTVQVVDLKNNIPELRVINSQNAAVSIPQMIGQSQSQQQSLQALFDNLARLIPQASGVSVVTDQQLPKPIQEQLQTLWRALPEANQLQQPARLKHAIQNSGVFLESHLLAASQHENRVLPALDVKTHLLRLAELIRQQIPARNLQAPTASGVAHTTATPSAPAKTEGLPLKPETGGNAPRIVDPDISSPPPRGATLQSTHSLAQILETLQQQTEAGLQRTLTHQLHMLNSENPRQHLVLELPVRHDQQIDVFDLRIQPDAEQHPQHAQVAQHTWSMMLAFDLEGLGPVRAQVRFHNNQISTHWWAEQSNTVQLFQQHIEYLKNRLAHVGIDMQQAQCQQGIPNLEAKQQQPRPPYSNVSLDEQV